MDLLRTPEERFDNLPGFPYEPRYSSVDGLRIHHVEVGPADGGIVLLLHGEPTWSYLYRHMIDALSQAGKRAIAPDLPGFGRSDKPADRTAFSYQTLVDWMRAWLLANRLENISLMCQDWGSLIGLRLVADLPERFARVVVSNGGLPTGDQTMPEAFHQWREFCQKVRRLPIGRVINGGTTTPLPGEVLAAYEAPFPDESYKEGARILPALVPISPDDPAAAANRAAWRRLARFDKPFLTAFSDGDPITAGGERPFQKLVKGAKGQPHTTIEGAGHFLQEDKGKELASIILDFMENNPIQSVAD